MTKLIEDHKLDTAVAGHCVSACAMIFLSGARRRFTDGEKLFATSLGFHGSYIDGRLASDERLQYLKGVVTTETAGKADPALVDQWLHLTNEAMTVRFRYPQTDGTSKDATIYACRGPRANLGDYSECNPIAGGDALSMGIITSTDILHMER